MVELFQRGAGGEVECLGMFRAHDLTRALRDLRLARAVHFHPSLGSTMDEAKRLAEDGAPEGTLVIAEAQTAGRGRNGRAWLTPPGSALAFSLVLRPSLKAGDAARLTMLAGVAVGEAIEQTANVAAALKWPNDVLINGQKTAGVLIESALRGAELDFAVLGLGLNVSWSPPPEAVAFPATCVQAEASGPVDRLALLRSVLVRLEARYDDLNAASLFADWRARLSTLGQWIEFRDGPHLITGLAEDVTPGGALLVRLDSGARQTVFAGEVRAVRAIDAPLN
jgi:BirA family biotin operon repressor/biotin-[acetyl-CoA-carboxylase] ligase